MKHLVKIIVIALAFGFSNLNALDFSYKGYVYNNLAYQKLDDSFKKLDTSIQIDDFANDLFRIRLMPELELTENTRITMNYELSGMVNKIRLPFYSNTEKTNRQIVKLNWELTNSEISDGINLFTNHYIDKLYLKQFFDWGELVVGRQVIAWGVGRIWQPTDLFNPINPTNFSKIERDGADAISSKIYIDDFSDLDIVVNFQEKLKDNNYGARYRTNFKGYDYSIMSGYFDRNLVVGGDFAGNLFDAGVRGEVLYSQNPDSSSGDIRFILGADYQFTGDLYALIEYQYNGFGTSDKDEYLNYFGRLMSGEIQNLSENYISVMATYMLHPLVSSALTSIVNLNDQSYMLGVTLNWNLLQNLNLGLGAMGCFGEIGTEYSYYPTAVYFTTEWYF